MWPSMLCEAAVKTPQPMPNSNGNISPQNVLFDTVSFSIGVETTDLEVLTMFTNGSTSHTRQLYVPHDYKF